MSASRMVTIGLGSTANEHTHESMRAARGLDDAPKDQHRSGTGGESEIAWPASNRVLPETSVTSSRSCALDAPPRPCTAPEPCANACRCALSIHIGGIVLAPLSGEPFMLLILCVGRNACMCRRQLATRNSVARSRCTCGTHRSMSKACPPRNQDRDGRRLPCTAARTPTCSDKWSRPANAPQSAWRCCAALCTGCSPCLAYPPAAPPAPPRWCTSSPGRSPAAPPSRTRCRTALARRGLRGAAS